jgi:serine/threonine protein phosphatase 1
MGDLHGAFKALLQVIDRSGFNPKKDVLICLGDICDGWPQVKECVDFLLAINCVFILGNHDQWFMDWYMGHHPGGVWTQQGGAATLASYNCDPLAVPAAHKRFFENAMLWYLDDSNRLFVHGGINPAQDIEKTPIDVFLWDRSLVQTAHKYTVRKTTRHKMTSYENVFVGHTSTGVFGTDKPMNLFEIWMLDTGAGWEGKLTLMELETKKYWQSDTVSDLYPGAPGRRGR